MNRIKRAQSLADYAIVLMVVSFVLFGMATYVRRSMQAETKQLTDAFISTQQRKQLVAGTQSRSGSSAGYQSDDRETQGIRAVQNTSTAQSLTQGTTPREDSDRFQIDIPEFLANVFVGDYRRETVYDKAVSNAANDFFGSQGSQAITDGTSQNLQDAGFTADEVGQVFQTIGNQSLPEVFSSTASASQANADNFLGGDVLNVIPDNLLNNGAPGQGVSQVAQTVFNEVLPGGPNADFFNHIPEEIKGYLSPDTQGGIEDPGSSAETFDDLPPEIRNGIMDTLQTNNAQQYMDLLFDTSQSFEDIAKGFSEEEQARIAAMTEEERTQYMADGQNRLDEARNILFGENE